MPDPSAGRIHRSSPIAGISVRLSRGQAALLHNAAGETVTSRGVGAGAAAREAEAPNEHEDRGMECPACGAANRVGAKFCASCGTGLALRCAACGTPFNLGDRFCAECGTALPLQGSPTARLGADGPAATGDRPGGTLRQPAGNSAPSATAAQAPVAVSATTGTGTLPSGPVAERRLVSVLFADLVGFTTHSEDRDPEETRDLLSRYFDTARAVIERYGGTVEKFIGDAVMAVWGAPIAHEDDPERAVRAALELIDRVEGLADETGTLDLALRAGVLTGEAAVTIGATNQGMVAGDLVNTASRLQSSAAPGSVVVGEATRRATEAAIAYEAIGEQTLKGKAAPVAAFRALRVLAGRGGALRYEGLEPPFVGRDREFRLIKDLLHASATDRKAHLVSVIGQAGIGKSRLAWELFKYIDGVRETIFWHQGRCLAYGEGVTYWALADMIRMRTGIAEGEAAESALRKLAETTAAHIPDAEERAWIEPRLAHLLGLQELVGSDKRDLFSAWRLFFERLAAESLTVLVFEDMQWADPALLEFLEHLLDWSRHHPIFVLVLARPEIAQIHEGWGRGTRSFTSLYLEPLDDEAMSALLAGLAPGIPVELAARILARAEGIPMYAVETVRMLLDRGLLTRDGTSYRPSGEIEDLEVPESLQGLIAARLDGLTVDERSLVQDAAVLGKTLMTSGLTALSGRSAEELEPLLGSLVRKEILTLEADPRSPERGQYGFIQDLVRTVAYDSLARRERRRKHLAAAEYLESHRTDEDEIAEVVASHYLEAHRLAPDAGEAPAIGAKARQLLTRSADRAASLGASAAAQRMYEQAAELADDPAEQARLWEGAGTTAWRQAVLDTAERELRQSVDLYEQVGDRQSAARVGVELADLQARRGLPEEALQRIERAYESLVLDPVTPIFAHVAAALANAYFFLSRFDDARSRVETALAAAEQLGELDALARALNIKAMVLRHEGRPQESLALLAHAVEIVRRQDARPQQAGAYNNLGDHLDGLDRYEEALEAQREGLAICRRFGDRPMEWFLLSETTFPLEILGRWDEVLEAAAQIPEQSIATSGLLTVVSTGAQIHIARGEIDVARRLLSLIERYEASPDFQESGIWAGTRARILRAEGDPAAALELLRPILAHRDTDLYEQTAREAFVDALEAAVESGDRATAEAMVARIEALAPGQRPPSIAAHARRVRGRLTQDAVARDELLSSAAEEFRALKAPFWLAVTLLEHAELLAESGSKDAATSPQIAPLLAEAGAIFAQLRAATWLARLARVRGAPTTAGSLVPGS